MLHDNPPASAVILVTASGTNLEPVFRRYRQRPGFRRIVRRSLDELSAWASRRFPGSPLTQDDRRLAPYTAELAEYFRGERHRFTVPFDLQGTPFQQAVWQSLCAIPFGQTRSYSDIAESIRKPAAVRAVGTAIGANPLLVTVPCHRVIGKNGALTGYRGGLEMKTRLLELERAAIVGGGGC